MAHITSYIVLLFLITRVQARSARHEEDPAPPPVRFVSLAHLPDNLDDPLPSDEENREEAKEEAEFLVRDHSRDKQQAKHQWVCPHNFFACSNGECIAPRWRCDGHYDCDDYSDELNCTRIELPLGDVVNQDHHSQGIQAVHMATAPHDETELKFNSSIEPLMLISTGDSIRGFWMQTRVYFDVVSIGYRPNKQETQSITQALSIFFDLLNLERQAPQTTTGKPHADYRAKSTIVGVDMEPNDKEVFWVELGKDPGLYSRTIDNDQFESRHRRQFDLPKSIISSGLLSPEDVALDTLGKNVYITDAGLPAIVVCHYKRSYCKKLVDDKLHKPRAIIADSSTGWLTYTDWGDHPGIFLVSMDGKRRETLIDTDVVWPNGLAADYETNHLYWADARLSKIECINLTTKKRREVIRETAGNPFSLALFENRIYWSDWSGNDIKTCDKNTGNGTIAIMKADSIYGIHIYHPSLHAKSAEQVNPCWSKQCSQLCLLAPASKAFADRKDGWVRAQCACSDTMHLSAVDHASCLCPLGYRFRRNKCVPEPVTTTTPSPPPSSSPSSSSPPPTSRPTSTTPAPQLHQPTEVPRALETPEAVVSQQGNKYVWIPGVLLLVVGIVLVGWLILREHGLLRRAVEQFPVRYKAAQDREVLLDIDH